MSFDSPEDNPHGLAWDGNYLWVVCQELYSAPTIYKIQVDGSGGESDIIIDEISGGFGLRVSIINNGEAPVPNVNWSLDIEANIGLVLSGSHSDGVFYELGVNGTAIIDSNNLQVKIHSLLQHRIPPKIFKQEVASFFYNLYF